jgi:hypothetical protein
VSEEIWLAIEHSLLKACNMPKRVEQSRIEQEARLEAFQDEIIRLQRSRMERRDQSELAIKFKGSVTINARELSVFLDLFAVTYNVSLFLFDYSNECAGPLVVSEKVINMALMEVSKLDERGQFIELEVEKMSFYTCLEITYIGSNIPLKLAVILSGGEMEGEPAGIEAAMPSLAKDCANLKNVFNDR